MLSRDRWKIPRGAKYGVRGAWILKIASQSKMQLSYTLLFINNSVEWL